MRSPITSLFCVSLTLFSLAACSAGDMTVRAPAAMPGVALNAV